MRAATRTEILEELARIVARCNGLISKEAVTVWADDLATEHDFAAIDYREAGRRMPDRIAEGGRGAMAGRPQITDVVALCKEARAKRLAHEASMSATKRLEARTVRSPVELAANAKTASWVIAQVQVGKPPTETAIAEYRAARVAEMGEGR